MRSDLMAGISSDAANDLVASAELVTFEPLETIFLEGQQARFFFCLLSGYVRLFKRAQSGRTADIRIYEPGDIFAECMLTVDSTYRHSAQAVDKTKVARFDIAAVRNLATKHPSIDKVIMNVMSRHLIELMDCVANDRALTGPQKLAAYLLERSASEGRDGAVRLPFQKSLLASKLGLAPEALSRAFSALRDRGVSVNGRNIRINDIEALSNF